MRLKERKEELMGQDRGSDRSKSVDGGLGRFLGAH